MFPGNLGLFLVKIRIKLGNLSVVFFLADSAGVKLLVKEFLFLVGVFLVVLEFLFISVILKLVELSPDIIELSGEI